MNLNLPKQKILPCDGKPRSSGMSARSAIKADARVARAEASAKKKRAKTALRAEVTPQMKGQIIARDNGICRLCLLPTTIEDPPEVDHVLPVAQFPRTCESNLATLHRSCNKSKGARPDAIPTILRNMGHAIKPPDTPENAQWREKKSAEVDERIKTVTKDKPK